MKRMCLKRVKLTKIRLAGKIEVLSKASRAYGLIQRFTKSVFTFVKGKIIDGQYTLVFEQFK